MPPLQAVVRPLATWFFTNTACKRGITSTGWGSCLPHLVIFLSNLQWSIFNLTQSFDVISVSSLWWDSQQAQWNNWRQCGTSGDQAWGQSQGLSMNHTGLSICPFRDFNILKLAWKQTEKFIISNHWKSFTKWEGYCQSFFNTNICFICSLFAVHLLFWTITHTKYWFFYHLQ